MRQTAAKSTCKGQHALKSAGVGITPMLSMLEVLSANDYQHPVSWIHGCESASQHSFADRTETLCASQQWPHHIWYNQAESDQAEYFAGFIDFSRIELPTETGDFYLCGPVGFMQFAKNQLEARGVATDRIHYEVFGPHASL